MKLHRILAAVTTTAVLAAVPVTSTATAFAPAAKYQKYVALGDSYTSAPLVPLPELLSLGCLRSISNYPKQLAAQLQVTLGSGGNDFSVFGDIVGTCPGLRDSDPAGAPCEQHFTVDGKDINLLRALNYHPRYEGQAGVTALTFKKLTGAKETITPAEQAKWAAEARQLSREAAMNRLRTGAQR